MSFLAISIVFTKSSLSLKDIGDFELFLFIASAITFFWVTGIIQSLLPLFNNNQSYGKRKTSPGQKSPELFNAFLLIFFISVLLTVIGFSVKDSIQVYKGGEPIPYAGFLLIYLLLSSPACLIEYIYLLNNKSYHILGYGFLSFAVQTFAVIAPVVFGYGLIAGMWGLILVTLGRFIWLLVLIKKYSEIKISLPFIKEHFTLALPLIISSLLSGSAQYIDGIIVSAKFPPEKFAIFRYGAKEMPLVITLASGLSNAMLTQFGSFEKIKFGLLTLKKRSLRLMHFLFPISIILMLFSNDIFPGLFTPRFNQSSDIFMVYLLLIISRLIFPQTILIGLKKNKVVMMASVLEIILNVGLTLLFIPVYGIVGVAVATIIIFILEKLVLVAYNYFKLGIHPFEYIPVYWYLGYSALITIIFVLIDHRIIMPR